MKPGQGQFQRNYMYLYDLPKDQVSSIKIAEAFRKQCDGVIEQRPQIRRDFFRPFYSAIVNIPDQVLYKKACDEMRYFEIDGDEPGKRFQCRALPFDNSLLGSNKEKLATNNVFYKAPEGVELNYKDLETKFSEFGKIKSLKISLNSDHSQKGFAYICFENQDGALKATLGDNNVKQFEQKDNRQIIGKLVNNLYFKNIPAEMKEEDVKGIFAPFGHIKSLVLFQNEIGQFGFVCFDDPNNKDKLYGPDCVNKALDSLLNRDMGNGLKLYVRQALSKSQREQEKLMDTIRYKSSKKRVNLYVKNFPNNWTEEDLTNVFSDGGKREIENVRLEKGATGNSYAFVCFKQPDACAAAKTALSNQTFDGKVLIINNYEIKEIRAIQMAELKDKTDWEKYRQQQTGGFQWNDLTSQPHLTQIIQQLLTLMQQNDQVNHRQGGDRRMNNQGGQQNRRPYNNQQRQQYQGGQQQQQMGQQPGMPQQQPNMPRPMPGMPQQPQMPQQPGMPQQPPQAAPQQMRPQASGPGATYVVAAGKILPSVSERNPYLKEQVGHLIYDFVQGIIGVEKAPKITGMLIELPVAQIKEYLSSFEGLEMKVREANNLLDQEGQQ